MNTDILCEIHFPEGQETVAAHHLATVFTMLRTFEARYSRFQEGNDLWLFNQSASRELSPELYDILRAATYFYKQTHGLFDPSILPVLEQEGYASEPYKQNILREKEFSALTFDTATRVVQKPKELLIDLGGIGKGFAVDQMAAFLSKRFDNFLIDAGGDIYARGTNRAENYPYFAVEVEHPIPDTAPVALLLLRDLAVATSGRNRRHWKKDGNDKHHLIDPRTEKSASTDYLSVTVIAGSCVAADVLAKILFVAGKEQAPLLANTFHIPAIFVEDDGRVRINQYAQPYVWKA